jgi:hypothetical protein
MQLHSTIRITYWIVAIILAAVAHLNAATIRYVSSGSPPGGNGQSWNQAYKNLQDALTEATANPDITEIRVAQGTYRPDQGTGWSSGDRSARFKLINGVRVAGGYVGPGAPDPNLRNIATYQTILSGDLSANDGTNFTNYGENSYHVVAGSGTQPSAILDGFTVKGGNPDGAFPFDDQGGGFYCDSGCPTVIDCRFTANTGERGTALYYYRSECPSVIRCTLDGNYATDRGGAISCWLSSPQFTKCTINGNRADFIGGGLYSWESSPGFVQCAFSNNGSDGGAAFMGGEGGPSFVDCTFTNNYGLNLSRGGAAFCSSLTTISFNRSVFTGNFADEGGAIWCGEDSTTVQNCMFSGNTATAKGSAIYGWAESMVKVDQCTFKNNSSLTNAGGALTFEANAQPTVSNCILWGDTPRELYTLEQALVTVKYCDVQAGQAGVGGTHNVLWQQGNINVNPLFGPNQDYHLQAASPCINAADPTAISEGQLDIDKEGRIYNARADIGCDERRDCNANGVADHQDIANHSSADCTDNVIPDECEPDCNHNGVADSCDLAGGMSADCSNNGIPDSCEPDCNNNGVADSCDILSRFSSDCNANGIPDECIAFENDCNVNQAPDDCETADGTAADCDANGVPDECQNTTADCDGNGVWDACDLATGTGIDQDQDGVIDACETLLVLYVDDNGPGDPGPGNPMVSDPGENGTSQHPFDAIREAVNAAIAVEDANPTVSRYAKIVIKDGTYTGAGNKEIDVHGRRYLIQGENSAESSVVDCQGAGRGFKFVSGETAGTRLSELTIRNGNATLGGAIYCESGSPHIANCRMLTNIATNDGGAVYCANGSHPVLVNCLLENNQAQWEGGGLLARYDSAPLLSSCIFRNNSTVESGGGGVGCRLGSSATIEDCTFEGNHADFSGGGLNCEELSNLMIVRCTFVGNSAGHLGGGVHFEDSHVSIINSVFSGNSASTAGGGVICHLSSHSAIINCQITNNKAMNYTGGGLESSNCVDLKVANCTISENTDPIGGGFHAFGGFVSLANSILWGNSSTQIKIEDNCEVTIHHNNIEGGLESLSGQYILVGDVGNFDVNPQFMNPAHEDFRITSASPCIDAGDNSAVFADRADLDNDGNIGEPIPHDALGQTRFINDPNTIDTGIGTPPIVDIGAFEFQVPFANGDLNCDGTVTTADVAPFVMALISPSDYIQAFPNCNLFLADMNNDFVANALDIQLFVGELLSAP